MNIQFGRSKNNTNKVKKIYNKGTIITARPQTAKYPYKILSIREFPKPNYQDAKKVKIPKSNKNYIINNHKNTMVKSLSFLDGSRKIREIKTNGLFNQSSLDNNKIWKNKPNFNIFGDVKRRKIFSASQRKNNDLSSINNEHNTEMLEKNRKLLIKSDIEEKNDNKKKVSSYSMSKYIEKYIDMKILNNNKKINVNTQNNSKINLDIYNKINNDDNNQIIHFLSEVINTDNLSSKINNNIYKYNFNTTNNILNNFNKNKNKNLTRNQILKKIYSKNRKTISLSYTKNSINELKPSIINFRKRNKFIKEQNKNVFLQNKKKNEIKLQKNKSSKIPIVTHKTENNVIFNSPIAIEANKKDKNDCLAKEERENNNKNNNIEKFKLKNKYKRKFKFGKNIKFKNKKKKVVQSHHEINNGFLKYTNTIKIENFNYIDNTNNQKSIKYRKNSDIYDYLISPKNYAGIIDETTKNDNFEFKSINQ